MLLQIGLNPSILQRGGENFHYNPVFWLKFSRTDKKSFHVLLRYISAAKIFFLLISMVFPLQQV